MLNMTLSLTGKRRKTRKTISEFLRRIADAMITGMRKWKMGQ